MAYVFNGTTTLIQHGDSSTMDALAAATFALWINPNAPAINTPILHKQTGLGSPTTGFMIGTGAAATTLRLGFNTAIGSITSALPDATWTHVVLLYDGSQVDNGTRGVVYVNGIKQTVSWSGTVPASYATNAFTPTYCRRSDSAASYFKGSIENVQMWSTALTAGQVEALYFTYPYAPVHAPASLELWAPYDVTEGVTAVDYSGKGLTGTITGAVTAENGSTQRFFGSDVIAPLRGSRNTERSKWNDRRKFGSLVPRFQHGV